MKSGKSEERCKRRQDRQQGKKERRNPADSYEGRVVLSSSCVNLISLASFFIGRSESGLSGRVFFFWLLNVHMENVSDIKLSGK